MDLAIIWFLLIGVLLTGFFVLEGFDFGVGILLPFLGRNEKERDLIIGSIAPVWDGNEVWMITAGGAMFAAFPHWYASLFSAYYVPFVLLLTALILRGIGIEFRFKIPSERWRRNWGWAIFGGSLTAAFLWGVVVANFVVGIPINASMHFVGSPLDLIQPYALAGGLSAVLLFVLHGALFLSLKVGDEVGPRALAWARGLAIVTALVMVLTTFAVEFAAGFGSEPVAWVLPALLLVTLALVYVLARANRPGWGFLVTLLIIIVGSTSVFIRLFPNVMLSSLDPAWNMTIANSSSSPATLKMMTGVAVFFVPIILVYEGWSYWVFRKRLTGKVTSGY